MRKRHRHPLSSKGIYEYMHKPHTCRGTHNEYNRCELLGIVWARTEGFMGHEARVGTPGYTPGDARNCNAKPTMLAVKIYSSLCIVVTFKLYQVSYSLYIPMYVCKCPSVSSQPKPAPDKSYCNFKLKLCPRVNIKHSTG